MIIEPQIRDQDISSIEDVINATAETKKPRFTKRKLLSETATAYPEEAIKEIFLAFGLSDLSDILEEWLLIAMRNHLSAYEEAADRADLIDFCHELQKLIEALFIINQKNRETNLQECLTEEQLKIAAIYDKPALLTLPEQTNPEIILKNFLSQFSLDYIRTELWDLTESTIVYEEADSSIEKLSKQHILVAHECFLSLVLASLGCRNKNISLLSQD